LNRFWASLQALSTKRKSALAGALPIEDWIKLIRLEKTLIATGQTFADEDLTGFCQHFSKLGFPTITLRQGEKKHVPSTDALVFVVNKPLTQLETAMLARLLMGMRPDLKVVMAHQEEKLAQLKVISLEGQIDDQNAAVVAHLNQGGAILCSPARQFSKLDIARGLKDSRWSSDFLEWAEHSRAHIVPVFLDVNRLLRVYGAYLLRQPVQRWSFLSSFAQVEETELAVRIGASIPHANYHNLRVTKQAKARLIRKDVYRLPKNKRSLFSQNDRLDEPQARWRLKQELKASDLLGETPDGMQIFLYQYREGDSVIPEIGRLREASFRMIGEGTGDSSDIDAFDRRYFHIVLWDESEEEIAGAYRLKPTNDKDSLYTETLFRYQDNAEQILVQGLELGRSFVQPKYWGSRSLDYLWVGIAAFLKSRPVYRYLLGAVSISNSFSEEAKDLLVYYYTHYYGAQAPIASGIRPYFIPEARNVELAAFFEGMDAKQAFVALKERLGQMSYSVPMLYKQYTALCEQGGVLFHGFNVDPDFSDCIDGLVVVDMNRLLPSKRKRYGLSGYQL